MAKKRKGTKFIFASPDPDKTVISMVKWRDCLYVATQKGVYRIEDDDKLIRLQIIDNG